MPILPTLHLKHTTDIQFREIDSAVMDCSYDSQNKFGRLFDERIYENDVAARLRALGFVVHTQVPLLVTFGDFQKKYLLDLVVGDMVYELKVLSKLVREHDNQALHYAMLQDIPLVKLLNFGEEDVRGKLLRNAVMGPDRHCHTMRKSGFQPLTPECERLVAHLKELIKDWGTHLDRHLYTELVHYLGGEEKCLRRIEMAGDGTSLGTQAVLLHAPRMGFVVTAFHVHNADYQRHLEILLNHASLRGLQWINLNRQRLEITTLTKRAMA